MKTLIQDSPCLIIDFNQTSECKSEALLSESSCSVSLHLKILIFGCHLHVQYTLKRALILIVGHQRSLLVVAMAKQWIGGR